MHTQSRLPMRTPLCTEGAWLADDDWCDRLNLFLGNRVPEMIAAGNLRTRLTASLKSEVETILSTIANAVPAKVKSIGQDI